MKQPIMDNTTEHGSNGGGAFDQCIGSRLFSWDMLLDFVNNAGYNTSQNTA